MKCKRLNPVAVLLSILFAAAIDNTYGAPVLVISTALYFIALNLFYTKISSRKGERHEIPDSFLLAFAELMKSFSREKAFLMASKATAQTNTAIRHAEMRIKDGCPLPQALRSAARLSHDERPLLLLLSEMLSFSADLTVQRMPAIVQNRQERRKLRNEMSIRLQVVALRLKVLTVISSAVLGVISFVSPIISALSGAGHTSGGSIEDLLTFDPLVFYTLLSLTIASSYSVSCLIPYLNRKRIVAVSGMTFIATHLVMIFAIK